MTAAIVKGYLFGDLEGVMYWSLKLQVYKFYFMFVATWSTLVESCLHTGKEFREPYRHVRALDCSPFGRNTRKSNTGG